MGGNGGWVEMSGKSNLSVMGSVDASAPNGNAGTWLLDPENVTITSNTSNGSVDNASPTNTYMLSGDGATI